MIEFNGCSKNSRFLESPRLSILVVVTKKEATVSTSYYVLQKL